MKEPEDWLPHELEEFIQDGRSAGIGWMQEQLADLAEQFINGDMRDFKKLIKSISPTTLDYEEADSQRDSCFNLGFEAGRQQARRLLDEVYSKVKPTKLERVLALAAALNDLEELDEGTYLWPEDMQPSPVGKLPEYDAAYNVPTLDATLIERYREKKPATVNFWDIQTQIDLAMTGCLREVSLDELVQRLAARGLENEVEFLPLFVQQAPGSLPIDVLRGMSLALQAS